MRSVWVGSLLFLGGIASGCSSVETEAVPDEHYEWGNVTVDFTATGKAPRSLTLRVTGQTAPLVFPSRTPPSIDGALVEPRYTCGGDPGPYEIALSGCIPRDDGTRVPWLEAVFTPEGVRGSYIDPTGARCDLTAGTAAFRIPRTPPLGTSNDAAVGSFTLECQDAVGGTKQLEGEFVVTARVLVLTC